MKNILTHAAIVAVVAVSAVVVDRNLQPGQAHRSPDAGQGAGAGVSRTIAEEGSAPTGRMRAVKAKGNSDADYFDLQSKPFAVTQTKAGFSWTEEDGLDPAVVRVLATNSEQEKALLEEQVFTKKRQLIYADAAFSENARKVFEGETEKITLPGFDGQTFEVTIDHTRAIDASSVSGSFTGRIKGALESQVIAAADNDYWSIGIDLDGKHYQIQTRQPGEWHINDIDINKAIAHHGPCGTTGERSPDSVGTPALQ